MTADGGSAFTLERPPVTQVNLTVAFNAAPPIQGWHLADLYSTLRTRYLSVSESAPVPARNEDERYEFLPAGGSWPIARTEFARTDGSLAVQGDLIDVVWDFGHGEGSNKYVGFDSLVAEMGQVYGEFVEALSKNGVELEPRMAECRYVNDIVGLSGPELAVGVLTAWASVEPRPVAAPGYVGVRMHACASTEHRCSSWVMVDADDDEPPKLTLRVNRRVSEADADAIEALREAHDELIELFRRHTSDALRKGWGEQ